MFALAERVCEDCIGCVHVRVCEVSNAAPQSTGHLYIMTSSPNSDDLMSCDHLTRRRRGRRNDITCSTIKCWTQLTLISCHNSFPPLHTEARILYEIRIVF